MARHAEQHTGRTVHITPRRIIHAANWAPDLALQARRCGARVVHAWGIEAAAACSARLLDLPLVLTLIDPEATRTVARWVRSFPTDATVVAGSQIIRTRLLQAGVAPRRVVVIRGPTDFGAINKARRADLRNDLVGEAKPVLLLSGPPSRSGGQFYGLWAAAIIRQIHRGLRVIMPYVSHERDRLIAFVNEIRMGDDFLVLPDSRLTWLQLATCADAFVLPAIDEVCTEPLSAAMAAGLPIVGTAVRSTAEILAHNHNSLLCKPREPRLLASRILTALEDEPLRRRITETARGQAYEVFGARAFADNYARVYENVLAGNPPGDAVTDTAMVA